MNNEEITFFARTNFRKQQKSFGIKRKDRRQHMYVVGKTGVGKTALLKNFAIQDIYKGEGLAIVDPHGQFIEEVLQQIPSHRVNDVVYFNPVDTEFPISFNILEASDPKFKHLIASGLIGVFTKIWSNVWSARMEYILSNCILALLDTPGSTLLGIPRLLVDKNYRQKIINNIKDSVVKSFWVNEFQAWGENYRNEAIAPIQNKVGQFLNVSLIRNIVGQSKSTINIPDIMDNRKILLVDVSKGRIGEDNSSLLGSMLITQIQLSTMERVRIPEEERKDFYLYVDEFQNFATDSFASILSEARKYRLNLIIAHQYIGQLVTETSTKVRDAIFGNVGTMIVFRIGAADAEFLENEFIERFTVQDLVNLPNYSIYLKLMIDGITNRPFSAQTLAPADYLSKEKNNVEKVIRLSRERYGQPRQAVEEKIARWSGIFEESGSKLSTIASPRSSPSGLYDAICSLCEKKVKVIFQPDGKRPVFCESCLKKAKKGEIEIPKELLPARQAQPTKKDAYLELEKLGIEFSPSQDNIKTQEQKNNTTIKQEEKNKRQIKKEEYKTECWKCKQKIKVKFKPDGIRPIFCNDCFAKKREERKHENKKTQKHENTRVETQNFTSPPKTISLKQAFQQKPTSVHQTKKQ
ncbi:type IV secretion system DNA-binding domain-containing protein [Candidatus Kuenenbacteria bacterium]|nr:type IV secretion system DNA-binding domain-containing protein [Candidatus Kuenenbacteria bacterium]